MQPPPLMPSAGAPAAQSAPPRFFYERWSWRLGAMAIWTAFLLLLVVIVGIIGAEASSHFLSENNFRGILDRVVLLGLIVPPMVMIIAAGGVDLSVGATAGFVAVLTGSLLRHMGIAPAFAIAVWLALIVGIANGLLVGLGRIHAVIVTLGMALLLRGLCHGLSGSQVRFLGDAPSRGLVGLLSSPYFAWPLLALVSFGTILLVEMTRIARRPAPGPDEQAESSAARTLYVALPYVLAALTAAMAAGIWLRRMGVAEPMLGTWWEADVIFAVILGGTCLGGRFGNVVGALVGIVLVVMIQQILYLKGVSSFFSLVVIGMGLLAFAVIGRLYYGLLGWLYRRSLARRTPALQPVG